MKFHENRLLADNSYGISSLIFFKLSKMSQNLSSAAVVIGALRCYKQDPDCFVLFYKIEFGYAGIQKVLSKGIQH